MQNFTQLFSVYFYVQTVLARCPSKLLFEQATEIRGQIDADLLTDLLQCLISFTQGQEDCVLSIIPITALKLD